MTSEHLNLVKLCVGVYHIDQLRASQAAQISGYSEPFPRHVTRMRPRRSVELLNGGSLYWVIKGLILCRQEIVALETVFDSIMGRRCAIILDPNLIRTKPIRRRPFQGWRYLYADDTPPDL
ncbi:MAG: DUF1489 domain-containing protein [Aestuariivita sp.]|nr:DUF1489 domain-containing protein [Aestuariivita sp.]MCY4203192.1 DUF1489 domain-containing protein [Aestuariivita sp.]MCY4287783.1 DUF1489 domain-containing protein [Aestuariivita sp.]MCY4345742.1 DUF1489 domain-containing protein [Aestuariivita sp.]